MSTDLKGETLNDGVIVELEVANIPYRDATTDEVKEPQQPQEPQQRQQQQPQTDQPQNDEPQADNAPAPQNVQPEEPQPPHTEPPQEEEDYKHAAIQDIDETIVTQRAEPDGNYAETGRTDYVADNPPPFDPTVDASPSAPVMQTVLKKDTFDHWFIIYSTLVAMSIGVFIFIFTNLESLILIGACVGFVASTAWQTYEYYKKKRSKSITAYDIAPSSDENAIISAAGIEFKEELSNWEENKEEDAVYVQTDFDNAYVDAVDEEGTIKKLKKKRTRSINITGSTRAFHKKESGVLMLEKRSLFTFQDYKGYEIGGGLSSMAGFSISIIVRLLKAFAMGGSDEAVDWGQVLLLLFITFACLCLGCVIEMELRKSNVLPPNKKLYQTATSIALHEIKSIDRHSTMNFQNVTSELDEHAGAGMMTKKIAIKWFHAFLGVYKICRWVFIALFINTAFVMLVLTFIEFGLLFDLTVNKSDAWSQTFPIVICLWVSVAIGLFAIYYTSQGAICHCGNKPYKRLSTKHRVTQSKQQTLWLLFVSATICLLIAAALVSHVDDQMYDRVVETEELDPIHTNLDISNKQYCIAPDTGASGYGGKSNSNSTRRRTQDQNFTTTTNIDTTTTNIDTDTDDDGRLDQDVTTIDIYTYEPFCVDSRELELMAAFYFVWIAWYILVAASYIWRKYDEGIFNFDLKNNLKAKRIWKRYSVLNIGLKTHKQDTQFALFSLGTSETIISVELDPKDADKLHQYLNAVVPWFKTHAFYPHTLYSKIDYNQNVVRNNQDAYNPDY